MGLLKKGFGEISATISNQIENLVLNDLESLTEDILDFNSLEDLQICLEERLASSSKDIGDSKKLLSVYC